MSIAAGTTGPPLLPLLLLLFGADVSAELPAVAVADTGRLDPDPTLVVPAFEEPRWGPYSGPRCPATSARRRALSGI